MDIRSRSYAFVPAVVALVAAGAAAMLLLTTVASRAAAEQEASASSPATAEVVAAALPGEFFQYAAVVHMKHTAVSASVYFAVPAGNRLVVENLSGFGAATGIQSVIVGQSSSGVAAVLPPKVTTTSWKWIGTTPTKVRFNAGNVYVALQRSAPFGTCDSCSSANYVTITGYLVAQ